MSLRPSEPGAKKAEMNPIKRRYAKPTRKTAINAMCACMGCTSVEQRNHLEPGFRNEIKHRTAPACPCLISGPFRTKKSSRKVSL